MNPAWNPTTVRIPTTGASRSERSVHCGGSSTSASGAASAVPITIDPNTTGKAPIRRTACASTGSGAPQPIAEASPKKIVGTGQDPSGSERERTRAPSVAWHDVLASQRATSGARDSPDIGARPAMTAGSPDRASSHRTIKSDHRVKTSRNRGYPKPPEICDRLCRKTAEPPTGCSGRYIRNEKSGYE